MAESLDPNVLMAALAGSGMYVQMLPHLSEVRRAAADSATARDVRVGIVMASAALVGAGAVIGVVERDVRPVVFTIVLAVLMGGIYELTLRQTGEAEIIPEAPRPRWA